MEQYSAEIITGARMRRVQLRLLLKVYRIALKTFGNPISALTGIREILRLREMTHDVKLLPRLVSNGKTYYSTESMPGFPSKSFDLFMERELRRIKARKKYLDGLHTIFLSITSKCKLSCDHCLEFSNLGADELLDEDQVLSILEKVYEFGITHIQISGGEPIVRPALLKRILLQKKESVDYWMLTSGYELTRDLAHELKSTGLTGVVISLDHWDEYWHNNFRHNKKSFYWVEKAIANCQQAGIITALSICATREFLEDGENLWKYIHQAHAWKVGFVRILEPGQVGGFKDKDVILSKADKAKIEVFYKEIISNRKYRNYPIVTYPGYHQKHHGCFGAGNRYLYIDSKGETHACPFCQSSAGNVLNEELQDLVHELRQKGCHMFQSI